MDSSPQAALLRIQNMILLCQQLKLPVQFKVSSFHRQPIGTAAAATDAAGDAQQPADIAAAVPASHVEQPMQEATQEFAVVVHVLSDYAFKKYLQHCSASDLLLLRGLLLKVETDAAMSRILSARVQQAFLPKFENEGQDSSTADAIVQQADARPMVITIKHSGSLVTLSAQGFAAKNSLDNEFTAGAAVLLQAHFVRLLGSEAAALQRLAAFMDALQQRQLAISFEMVTGCHGHHGQLPAGEYLVATSAHTAGSSGQPEFLSWHAFLQLCLEFSLPLNDTWLLSGSAAAAAARELLDHLALSGCPTADALQQLTALVQDPDFAAYRDGAGSTLDAAAAAAARQGVHLPGTYPHEQWQGSRIEGFVVSQGQAVAGQQGWQQLLQLGRAMAGQVVLLEQWAGEPQLQRPYQFILEQSGNNAAATQAAIKAACSSWLPPVSYTPLSDTDRLAFLGWLQQQPPAGLGAGSAAAVSLVLPDGQAIYSRAAVDSCDQQQLQALLLSAAVTDKGAAQQATQAVAAAAAATEASPQGSSSSSSSMTGAKLKAMQALAGGVGSGQAGLRYKKKMMMWGEAEVGYCMMTFVIRNGLTALKQGQLPYLTSLANMAKHAWGLPGPLVEKVLHFGRCWSRWVGSHGGARAIQEANYLAAAEPFVQAFLAGTAAGSGVGEGPGGRPEGAFQGVLLAVDVEEKMVKQLLKALRLQHLLEPSSAHLLFSRSLVAEGCCVWLRQGSFNAKGRLADFIKAAAAYLHLVVQEPDVAGIANPSALKKVQGMHTGKLRSLGGQLKAAGLTPEQQQQRTVELPPAAPAAAATDMDIDQADAAQQQQQDEAQQQQQQQLVEAVVQQLGAGTPLAEADPAFVFCFVSLPATGKSALSAALSAEQLQASSGSDTPGGSSSSSSSVSIEVLNSDTLKAKKGITGMCYWHEVAGATASNRGGGHRLLVLADKNLVPNPRDNITRVADTLRKSGATSIAVLPTCTVDASTQQQQQQQPANAPQLPFPLEFLALNMLRVLQRSGHEGQLDSSAAAACRVIVQFGSYFKHMSLQRLRELLLGVFPHVVELPVASVGGGNQVPSAVLQHIADGLAAMQESGNNSSDSLPDAWEQQMRQLLSDPATQAAINSIALPFQGCSARLHASIHGILAGASAAVTGGAAVAAAAGSAAVAGADSVRYIGVAVVDEDQLRMQLQQLWEQLQPQQQQQQQQLQQLGLQLEQRPSVGEQQLEEQQAKRQRQEQQGQQQQPEPAVEAGPAVFKVKSGLHVTLWHRDQPAAAAELRDALLACAGQEVQLQLVALDTSPEVTAAQAELLAGPDSVTAAWQQLRYAHITLVVAPGAAAADSNLLPARVAAAGDAAAFRVVLPEPLLVTGQVLGFS